MRAILRVVRDLLRLPIGALRLLAGGVSRLQALSEDVRRGVKLGREILKRADSSRRQIGSVGEDIHTLRDEVRTLRRELHERLLQYHLQLGRLARAVDVGAGTETRLSGRSVPVEAGESEDLKWTSIGDGVAPPDPEGVE